MSRPATEPQKKLINALKAERGISDAQMPPHATVADASAAIGWLFKQPKVQRQTPRQTPAAQTPQGVDPNLKPGVYEHGGQIYVVKLNKDKTNLYAKRLVEIGGSRLTEAGTVVSIEFEYERGAIFQIKPDERMTLERAKELTLRYGRCINCGLKLKDAKSVARGIGPVCLKAFTSYERAAA